MPPKQWYLHNDKSWTLHGFCRMCIILFFNCWAMLDRAELNHFADNAALYAEVILKWTSLLFFFFFVQSGKVSLMQCWVWEQYQNIMGAVVVEHLVKKCCLAYVKDKIWQEHLSGFQKDWWKEHFMRMYRDIQANGKSGVQVTWKRLPSTHHFWASQPLFVLSERLDSDRDAASWSIRWGLHTSSGGAPAVQPACYAQEEVGLHQVQVYWQGLSHRRGNG